MMMCDCSIMFVVFFFQAEDGIRYLVRSRGLGDVYKRQDLCKKVYDAGFKIRFLPASVVIHEHGVSIKKDRANMIKVWNEDCANYFEKHFGGGLPLLWLRVNLKISGIIRVFLAKK